MTHRPTLSAAAIALLSAAALVNQSAAAILVQYDFDDDNGIASAVDPNVSATDYTGGDGLIDIVFLDNAAARHWLTSSNLASAIADGDYWEFVVTADAGYAMNLDSISLDEMTEDNGPLMFQIDINSIAVGSATSTTATFTNHIFTLSSIPALQNITSAVIRIAAWDAFNSNPNADWLNDNVTLNGDVFLQAPVPELSSLCVWAAIGAVLAFQRRNTRLA